jgi:hypothetical protein
MPAETATQTNASLAFLPPNGTSHSYVLVAQKGSEKCAVNCDVDVATAPGLYSVTLITPTPAARRWTATVPLTTAKSGRTTDGILVGRGDTWAIAQVASNESPPSEYTTVFTTKVGSGLDSVSSSFLPRGYALAGTIQPFVFAAAKTPNGAGGYAGTAGDFVEAVDGGAKAGFIPTHGTVTTNDPGAADVFARGKATPDDSILSFHNLGAIVPQTLAFAKMNKDASALVATERHVAFFGPFDADAGKAVTMHACSAADLLAKQCAPMVIDLPLETILRVRTRASSVYVLGMSAGTPRLVRVTLP